MSIEQHRTDQVFATIKSLTGEGVDEFRPGHIADALRAGGHPMLTWEIRGELARLEAAGLISADAATGAYQLTDSARKTG